MPDPGDRCECRKWQSPVGGGAPMGVAVTKVQVYEWLCVSVHRTLAATLYHTSAFSEFIHMHCCVCFALCVCVCVFVGGWRVGECSDSNTIWQNDHTLLPRAPRNLSAPLPFLHQPQRRNVRSHVCQRSFPVGSSVSLRFSVSPLPLFFPSACWHYLRRLYDI